MKVFSLVLGTLLLFITQQAHSINSEKTEVTRYAFITASNNGGSDRPMLRYAESDALALTKVFEEIGGLDPQNKTLLLSPSKQQFEKTLENLKSIVSRLKVSESRMEFFFYYSGHSDEEGLLLRDGKMQYSILKKSLQEIDSDIHVAILDSCQSGAFTRLKGGTRKSPFLLNSANQVKGHVFLTASSADEAAQESDNIGGSFFTHHLISALRGASDISGDNQVTLNEAYQYAFHETVSHTENSVAGAQHPAYNIQLAGAGDLVLTDLKTSSTSLVIPEEVIGHVFVRDSFGTLIAELNKNTHRDIAVSLEPGKYDITIDEPAQLYTTQITLDDSTIHHIDYASLTPTQKVVNRTRGAIPLKSNDYSFYDISQKGITSIHTGYSQSILQYEYYQGWGDEPEYPDVDKKYTGYNINLRRSFSPDYYLEIGMYELGGWGILKGKHITWMKNLFTKSFGGKDKIRFDIGLGVLQERLSSFPNNLSVYRAGQRLSKENVYGLRLPLSVSFENDAMIISAETGAKLSVMNDRVYGNNSQLKHININIGYRF